MGADPLLRSGGSGLALTKRAPLDWPSLIALALLVSQPLPLAHPAPFPSVANFLPLSRLSQ